MLIGPRKTNLAGKIRIRLPLLAKKGILSKEMDEYRCRSFFGQPGVIWYYQVTIVTVRNLASFRCIWAIGVVKLVLLILMMMMIKV